MLSVSLKYVTKSKRNISSLFFPIFLVNCNQSSSFPCIPWFFYSTATQMQTQAVQGNNDLNFNAEEIIISFMQWFKGQQENNKLPDKIFEILRASQDENNEPATDLALSQLSLNVSEALVLRVLAYGKDDVLSCIKFFDWAGHQTDFSHTRATFYAIFKIISKAKLMSLMLDFLGSYEKRHTSFPGTRFLDTLIMGYAVAGKPTLALQLFGRMRFNGGNLGRFAYHVLLNALVEEGFFDAVEVIAKQISGRGFESKVTHSILVKSLCKQNRLVEAVDYMYRLSQKEAEGGYGHELGVLIDALCKSKMYLNASRLLEEFRGMGIFQMRHAYGAWLRALVQAGNLDAALEFMWSKKSLEGYVPDVFLYNFLLCHLLRKNRLWEVCDMLVEMKEDQVFPNKITMNAVLCFFCKAGMMDVALELYHSRLEIGLSLNAKAYGYLINTLCRDGGIDEAYKHLKNSIERGYFPGKVAFSLLADSLCKQGKLEKMKELIQVAVEQKFMPIDSTYDKFISALCKGGMVEDGYLLHAELNRTDRIASKSVYFDMIDGCNKSNRIDIATRLLIEMQEKGYNADRGLFRAVICCLCNIKNPESLFLKLLDMQLSLSEPNSEMYNSFIDGAGHAKKPEWARNVYEMMLRSGIRPTQNSDRLLLLSYFKSDRISDAVNFFYDVRKRRNIGKSIFNIMIVRLCKASELNIALLLFREMRDKGIVPSNECYEVLVQALCHAKNYDMAVKIVNDFEKAGRQVTSFLGNVILFSSLNNQDLYKAWTRVRDVQDETPEIHALGKLIGAFSGVMNVPIEELEEFIEQSFPIDIYTYNMLLRNMSQIDHALQLFGRICQRGYEPNRWTYDILVHGLIDHGRIAEAKRLVNELSRNGFDLTDRTKLIINGCHTWN